MALTQFNHEIKLQLNDEEKVKEAKPLKCDNDGCNGGRAFEIRKKMFCCPNCGNKHFKLKKSDEDYWHSKYK